MANQGIPDADELSWIFTAAWGEIHDHACACLDAGLLKKADRLFAIAKRIDDYAIAHGIDIADHALLPGEPIPAMFRKT